MKKLITIVLFFTLQFAHAQDALKPEFSAAKKLLISKDFKGAVDAFTKVLGKAEDATVKKFCYIYRAFAYRDMRMYKKAVADMDEAIKLDPDDVASYNDRGIIKRAMDDGAGAVLDFKTVLKTDSISNQAAVALYYLASLSYSSGQFKMAIDYYNKYVVIDPADPEVYFNRGAAKGMLMDSEGAIEDYSKAIELKPDYMEAYANRGVSRINMLTANGNLKPTKAQTEDACKDLKKAKEMGDTTIEDMLFIYCNN